MKKWLLVLLMSVASCRFLWSEDENTISDETATPERKLQTIANNLVALNNEREQWLCGPVCASYQTCRDLADLENFKVTDEDRDPKSLTPRPTTPSCRTVNEPESGAGCLSGHVSVQIWKWHCSTVYSYLESYYLQEETRMSEERTKQKELDTQRTLQQTEQTRQETEMLLQR